MDLQEVVAPHKNRHPWEKVRARSIQKILHEFVPQTLRVLDIGCGDGFIAEHLVNIFSFSEYVGWDINLSAMQISSYTKRIPQVVFINDHKLISEKRFDLILLLDVIEHLEDDENFITNIVSEHSAEKSKMFITVPAFPSLYGSHDSFLGHQRRYTQKNLLNIVKKAQYSPLATGYMFASLLPVRAVSVFLQRTLPIKSPDYSGVGNWNCPKLFSKCIEHILSFDNNILFQASKHGIFMPGLSLWTLCEKQQ